MIDFQSSFSPYLSYGLVSFIQNDSLSDEGTYYPVNDLPSLVAKTTQALEEGAATKKDDTAKDASYSADIKTVSVPVPDASSDVTLVLIPIGPISSFPRTVSLMDAKTSTPSSRRALTPMSTLRPPGGSI